MSAGELLRKNYGMQGILTLPPEQGGVTEILCDMEECYCPRGRGHFDPLGEPLTDWMPTEDHHPKLRMWGGTRKPGNIRLAHRRCNRLGFGYSRGHFRQRWRAALESADWHKNHWKESAANAEQRGRWDEEWRAMRARMHQGSKRPER